MEDIAEQIVKCARTMPEDTGVSLECNGIVIAKVKVTGGVGLEVRSGNDALLFAMAAIQTAVRCFLTAAHAAPDLQPNNNRHHPIVRHKNGIAMYNFRYNDPKEHANAATFVIDILQTPPLCKDTPTVEKAVTAMDARGLVGWEASGEVMLS